MAEEVYMDIPAVEKMSDTFESLGELLDDIAKILYGLSISLKLAVFVSLGSTAAFAAMIDRIIPRVNNASKKLIEISRDIDGAVRAYRDGDFSGSQRFV